MASRMTGAGGPDLKRRERLARRVAQGTAAGLTAAVGVATARHGWPSLPTGGSPMLNIAGPGILWLFSLTVALVAIYVIATLVYG